MTRGEKKLDNRRLLFLDDYRQPIDCTSYMYRRGVDCKIYHRDWFVVRSYGAFVKWIKKYGVPDFVSFDHDLNSEEKWQSITNLEGVYWVSNRGRIKKAIATNGEVQHTIVAPSFHKYSGGVSATLSAVICGEKIIKRDYIHRFVAKAFILNPENKPEVNHLSGNRADNREENLEWATTRENVQHSHDYLERVYSAYAENHKNSKRVSQYDLRGNLIDTFGSQWEAERQTGAANVAKCCRGDRATAGGFVWKYTTNEVTKKSKVKHIEKKIYEYNVITEEYKGTDCARWLCEYCLKHNLKLPKYAVHSANPDGTKNIESILETYKKIHETKSEV